MFKQQNDNLSLSKNTPNMILESKKGNNVLTFDEEEHLYRLNGEPVEGVTTINKQGYPESFFLTNWKIKTVVDSLLSGLFSKDVLVKELPKKELDEVVKKAKGSWKVKAKDAADIGTLVHDYAYHFDLGVENLELLEKIKQSEQAFKCVESFKKWHDETGKDTTLYSESIVASAVHRYGGKFDRIVHRGDKVGILDYKTSSGIYADQFVQLGGYAVAVKEWLDLPVDFVQVVRFGKDGTFETREETRLEELQRQFIRNLETARFRKAWEG